MDRADVVGAVAAAVGAGRPPDCLRVGVDGVDGAGKTTFADELARALRAEGRPVVRVSLDDFHNPRGVRYRRGRESPAGYWLDSYDYARFSADVLGPLGPGGSRRYRPRAHDLSTDSTLDEPWLLAAPDAVLVADGLFLQRPELAGAWELVVFLDVPFAVSVARMAARDGTDPDPAHPSMRRYVDGQRRYLRECTPQRRAGVLVDNADPARPRLIRTPRIRET
ncbi:MAG: uridine kinase [Mycobacterium sp.]|jgi:uridine kinase|nr:uridine kinase [Mycobacterium sp.]